MVFHLIGAMSQYGKLGVTCIGDSPEDAEELYQRILDLLEMETRGGWRERHHTRSQTLFGKE